MSAQHHETGITVRIVDEAHLPLEGGDDVFGERHRKGLSFAAGEIEKNIGDLRRLAGGRNTRNLVGLVFALRQFLRLPVRCPV
ncbi:hypothetical protein D3C78_1297560 [compost metagenome]